MKQDRLGFLEQGRTLETKRRTSEGILTKTRLSQPNLREQGGMSKVSWVSAGNTGKERGGSESVLKVSSYSVREKGRKQIKEMISYVPLITGAGKSVMEEIWGF